MFKIGLAASDLLPIGCARGGVGVSDICKFLTKVHFDADFFIRLRPDEVERVSIAIAHNESM